MKLLILLSAVLVFEIVQSTTSSVVRSNPKQVARIPCNGLLAVNDEDRKGLSSITYTWKFRGRLVNKICTNRSRITISGYGDLLIQNFSKQDQGIYTCEVEFVTENGVRVVDRVQKNVNESYIISEIECPHSCISAKQCYYSSLPNTCPGKGDICCENNS